MDNAVKEIEDTYSVEEFQTIANHGCSSGVCHQHIYYGDTIRFYDKYEDEILEYIKDTGLEDEFLVDIFRRSNASINSYKNTVTWCFIEMIASNINWKVEEGDYVRQCEVA